MKLYICEICGDAYIGRDLPAECPFCGARHNFIKEGQHANPIINRAEAVGEESKKMLEEAYELETKAVAIYNCMAQKSKSYDVKAMFKRLAKIELEHAVIITRILGLEAPVIKEEECSNEMQVNFQRTIELEDNASKLYKKFAQQSTDERVRIFFIALAQVEEGHEALIKNNYLA